MSKRLIILFGPQGSGNHLFSKIFATDVRVTGWKMEDREWKRHASEPFFQYWKDPEKLTADLFGEFTFTSISAPYRNGEREVNGKQESTYGIPRILDFYNKCVSIGINTRVCIIGREPTILQYQQMRLRHHRTTPLFVKTLETIVHLDLYFLSHENLLLYRGTYLRQVSKDLIFPIDAEYPALDALLIDQNEKYIHPVLPREWDEAGFDEQHPDSYDGSLPRKHS